MAPATAAVLFVLFQVMVNAIGITADPIKTPIARYTNPRLRPAPNNITASPPIPNPKPTITDLETFNNCRPVAFGFL